jgi:hypothetical protein
MAWPGSVISPCSIIRAARSRLRALQALRGRRGVNRRKQLSASRLRAWLSIQP